MEDSESLLTEVLPHRPHARSLPVYKHRDAKQQEDELYDADPDKHSLGPVARDPARHEQAEDQAVEDVLAEVERDERLARVLAVAVDAERDGGRAAERAPERDDAEEDGRHDPRVALLRAPAEAHQPDDRRDGDGHRHDEAELGLVQPAVAPRHRFDDDVGDFAGHGCPEDAADEGADVDETGL